MAFVGRFAEQVAIVTGGGSGIGKAIATRLASEGAKVMIWDFNADASNATVKEIVAAGFEAEFTKVDVSNEASVTAAFDQTIKSFSRLDVLVNCAGIVGPTGKKITEVSVADFEKVQSINLTGSFLVTKGALPFMEKNSYGRILLIASVAGKEGNAGMSAYSTSKAAVIGLTKAVGKEYAETGITINALAPAVVRTQMVMDMPEEQVKYMTDKIPMKRCGTLDECAATACFIVSKEAGFNTGFCFDLTGGRSVY